MSGSSWDDVAQLFNRADSAHERGDLHSAVADYGRSIALWEAIRLGLGDRWPPVFQNDLAAVCLNRGNALVDPNRLEKAVTDHDHAIVLMAALCRRPCEQYPTAMQNDLAGAYSSLGNVCVCAIIVLTQMHSES